MSQPAQQQNLDFGNAPEILATIHAHPTSSVQISPLDEANRLGKRGKLINIGDIEQTLPSLAEHLKAKAFFSINGYPQGTKQLVAEQIRYLNACWVDIDFHKLGEPEGHIDYRLAETLARSAESLGAIPPASYFVSSGRGIWLLWLLNEPPLPTVSDVTSDVWQRAQGRIDLLRQINTVIGERLEYFAVTYSKAIEKLGVDFGAMNANRLMRLPNSINEKTGTPVYFSPRYEPNPKDPTRSILTRYTLEQLAVLVEAPIKELDKWPTKIAKSGSVVAWAYKDKRSKPTTKIAQPKQKPHRSGTGANSEPPYDVKPKILTAKQLKVIRARKTILAEYERILEHRGGIVEGRRNVAIYYYSLLMFHAGYTFQEARPKVQAMAQACKPPCNEFLATTISAWKSINKPPRNRVIANAIGVTQLEANKLGLRSIRPDYVNTTKRTGRRTDLQKARHEVLTSLWYQLPVPPDTLSEVLDHLKANGLEVSRQTLRNDLKKLGLYTIEQAMYIQQSLL